MSKVRRKWAWAAQPRSPAPTLQGDLAAAADFLRVSEKTLEDVTALCCGGIPSRFSVVAVWKVADRQAILAVELNGYGFSQSFRWDSDGELLVHFKVMQLPSHLQQQGIGYEAVRNSLIAYDRLKVRHVAAYANFEVGGYAWAKIAGAPVDAGVARELLLARLEAPEFKRKLTEAGCDALAQVVRDAHDDCVMYDVANSVSKDRPSVKLGRLLLLGFKWDAIWDLEDSAQRRRAQDALS